MVYIWFTGSLLWACPHTEVQIHNDIPLAACLLRASLWFCACLQAILMCATARVCVCARSGLLALNCWMLSLPIAERVQLHSPLRSVLCALWLLTADSSHQHCVVYGLERRPGRQVEEQSRIYTHKSDRCMVCHYLPLIIILPLLFILWATLAVFPAPTQEHL